MSQLVANLQKVMYQVVILTYVEYYCDNFYIHIGLNRKSCLTAPPFLPLHLLRL